MKKRLRVNWSCFRVSTVQKSRWRSHESGSMPRPLAGDRPIQAISLLELSRDSGEFTFRSRFPFLPGLLEMPIPQSTGHEGESILEIGAPIPIDLRHGSKTFDAPNGVFDDDANPRA